MRETVTNVTVTCDHLLKGNRPCGREAHSYWVTSDTKPTRWRLDLCDTHAKAICQLIDKCGVEDNEPPPGRKAAGGKRHTMRRTGYKP